MSTNTRDFNKTTELGKVLVTGGAGFVGQNFVRTLLNRGYQVRTMDLVACPIQHENLEVVVGNICNAQLVEDACAGIDTIFHTAAIIELKGGKNVTQEYRDRSYAVNVEGTKNIVKGAWKHGTKRLVYTASNSVVIGGQPIHNGDESMPYTQRFNDLYTETKVVAEKWVLEQNGKNGLLTCAIRPSGIWGPGDQTVFKRFFEQMVAGLLKVRVGSSSILLDNTFVHNLIHGQILAAQHLVEGGTAPGQAYFINDGEPINMFEFCRPVMEAIHYPYPRFSVPAWLVKAVMVIWQELHFLFKLPEPPLPPLAIDRIAIPNYFSIEKARRELGYQPLFNTEQGMKEAMPYYVQLYQQLKVAAGKA